MILFFVFLNFIFSSQNNLLNEKQNKEDSLNLFDTEQNENALYIEKMESFAEFVVKFIREENVDFVGCIDSCDFLAENPILIPNAISIYNKYCNQCICKAPTLEKKNNINEYKYNHYIKYGDEKYDEISDICDGC